MTKKDQNVKLLVQGPQLYFTGLNYFGTPILQRSREQIGKETT